MIFTQYGTRRDSYQAWWRCVSTEGCAHRWSGFREFVLCWVKRRSARCGNEGSCLGCSKSCWEVARAAGQTQGLRWRGSTRSRNSLPQPSLSCRLGDEGSSSLDPGFDRAGVRVPTRGSRYKQQGFQTKRAPEYEEIFSSLHVPIQVCVFPLGRSFTRRDIFSG